MQLHLLLTSLVAFAVAMTSASPSSRWGRGRRITLPTRQRYQGIKPIPDRRHPFRAPGRHDKRGGCPGLNTMANHGYIPRDGIATYEEIVNGAMEAYNMGLEVSKGVTAFAMLGRGNSYTNQMSIGGPSRRIPPLPNNLDGNLTKGLAIHGRFEGDVSLTRYDVNNGDNVNFQQPLFDEWLEDIEVHGDDHPDYGPKSIVSLKAISEFKLRRYLNSIAINPGLEFLAGRWMFSYGEIGFTMNLFANGTDHLVTKETVTSFFRDQTFPPNWHRNDHNVELDELNGTIGASLAIHNQHPGFSVNGTFMERPLMSDCDSYNDLAGPTLSRSLLEADGILKENVDLLLDVVHKFFGPTCERVNPSGEPGA